MTRTNMVAYLENAVAVNGHIIEDKDMTQSERDVN